MNSPKNKTDENNGIILLTEKAYCKLKDKKKDNKKEEIDNAPR